MVSMELTAAAGHPSPPRISNGRNGQEEAELERLATGDLLARIAGFLSVREGDIQSVLVAAPPAERIPFRDALVQNPAFLSQAVIPGGNVITDKSIRLTLASPSARRMIKAVLATPAGAKFLRQSAGSAASAGRPYTLDSDGRSSLDPSCFFANTTVAIKLDNPDLLEWAMEVGSLDPNGCHDYGLVLGEEAGTAEVRRSLLYQCFLAGSKECFEYLLSRDDVDPNARAYVRPGSDRWYSIVSACILCAHSSRFGDVLYFVRRLVEHAAIDINGLATDGQTPLHVLVFTLSRDRDVKALERALHILSLLLDAGAKAHGAHGDANDANPFDTIFDNLGPDTPLHIVISNTVSGTPENRSRHLLALDVMMGGCGVVTYFLNHGNSAAIVRMHGMATSALGRWPAGHVLLQKCVGFFFLSFLLFRVTTIPALVIKRRLDEFIFVDLLHLTVIFWVFYIVLIYIAFR